MMEEVLIAYVIGCVMFAIAFSILKEEQKMAVGVLGMYAIVLLWPIFLVISFFCKK